jgi:hypothetical protein
MAEKNTNMKESIVVIEEVESKLEMLFRKQKEEIEKELEEKIRAIKEEAGKKIEAIEKEIEKGRGILQEYRAVVGEFETERAALQAQLKEHFDKAISFQTEIERMAGLTLEELRKVNELSQKLEAIHHSAEERVGSFRKDLEERFGIVAELPESEEQEALKIDLDRELAKLKKIRDLLESEGGQTQETQAEEVPEKESEAASGLTPEPKAPLPVPGINELMEEALSREGAEAEELPVEEKSGVEERENFQSLFEILEKFRKIEQRNGNGEISFFRKDDKVILDGEYMIASIDESLEEAKRLYLKLSQTESPKEQFFIKQEIINHQEILRKYILRNLKMCEKEGALMPRFTEDILNIEILKDILEKLSMENWSNPNDFSSFRGTVEALKDTYYARITPPVHYLRSLIDELGV